MTQRDRILRMLREAGPRGVHSYEFYEHRMPRGAAAICTLRNQGFNITSSHEVWDRTKGVRYVLVSAVEQRPVPAGAAPEAAAPSADSLFDAPAPPRSHWRAA